MSPVHPLYERHRELLERAVQATRERTYWSPYPEIPKAYGEEAAGAGMLAYEGTRTAVPARPARHRRLGRRREARRTGWTSASPTRTPTWTCCCRPCSAAMPAWRDAGPDTRAACCLEIAGPAQRAHPRDRARRACTPPARPSAMAFQAGGPHAQDRGARGGRLRLRRADRARAASALGEAAGPSRRCTWPRSSPPSRAASAWSSAATPSRPGTATRACSPRWRPATRWSSSRTRTPSCRWRSRSRSCATRWPRPASTRTWSPWRSRRRARGWPRRWRCGPEIRIIDYTGSTEFGVWLERNARQAVVYTEKAGINTVVVDSADDYKGMLGNLAFSFSLYSGQMCTTPQNIFVPREGITVAGEHKSFDDFAADLAAARRQAARRRRPRQRPPRRDLQPRRPDPPEAGRIRRQDRPGLPHRGQPRVPRRRGPHPGLIAASTSPTPTGLHRRMVRPDQLPDRRRQHRPGLETFRTTVRDHGAITAAVYSTDDDVIAKTEDAALDAGVNLSVQPHRRRLREPDGGLLRLPRHRREPGSQRGPVRPGVRRQPVPGRAVPPPAALRGLIRR